VHAVIASILPSISPGTLLAGGVTATAASLWLLLPGGRSGAADRTARWLGWLLGIVALAGFIATGHRLGNVGEEAVFLTVALVAVISGAATVVSRSPVYAAIWFAMALAGVSGVLLVLGGQFLGVATIVVYAGAILVMFLFVLMLAQPAGLAPYDRVSNEPLLAAVAGAVLLGILSLSIGRLTAEPPACCLMGGTKAALLADSAAAEPATAAASGIDMLADNHVARLGGELFGRHLLAVEVAGVLLLVALIGSIAIVSRGAADAEPAAARRAMP
jgi:NADH-quinone oxidoreductase subunit J